MSIPRFSDYDNLPPKIEHLSLKIFHHQQLVNIYTKSNHSVPKIVIYSLLSFTRFCRQIHQSAKIGVWGMGGGQTNLGNAKIFRDYVTAIPPLRC